MKQELFRFSLFPKIQQSLPHWRHIIIGIGRIPLLFAAEAEVETRQIVVVGAFEVECNWMVCKSLKCSVEKKSHGLDVLATVAVAREKESDTTFGLHEQSTTNQFVGTFLRHAKGEGGIASLRRLGQTNQGGVFLIAPNTH